MDIGGLEKTTLVDFPGRVAATVFLLGCNFRCPFCYSSELVLSEKIKVQPKILEKKFFSFLKARKGLLDGIVICGGEPTIHTDLPRFIGKIKKLGYLVKLDTNGSNPEMLENLINGSFIDYVAMDIKVPKEKYAETVAAGISVEKIQKSIDILMKGKVEYEFRTTVVPTIHNKEAIVEMARWIKGADKYFLQNFKAEKTISPEFEKLRPYPKEFLLDIQKTISPLFRLCQIR